MSYTFKQLRTMAKCQNIKHIHHKGKAELCQLLNIPFDDVNDCYKHLQTIRTSPQPICLTNDETNEEHTFKSIYACAKHFNVNPGSFGMKKKYSKAFSNWIVIHGIKFTILYP